MINELPHLRLRGVHDRLIHADTNAQRHKEWRWRSQEKLVALKLVRVQHLLGWATASVTAEQIVKVVGGHGVHVNVFEGHVRQRDVHRGAHSKD